MATAMSDSLQLSVIALPHPIRDRSTIPPGNRQASHRHAAPSGPWPWMDFDSEDASDSESESQEVQCARLVYPQSHFGNWTPPQVRRSGIKAAIDKECICDVYTVNVLTTGQFKRSERLTVTTDADSKAKFKEYLETPRPRNIFRVRALCVENLSGVVLQMLGAHYNIEPFFFSSSLNWIPSRYQEELRPGQGDHISITLTFLRKMDISAPTTSELASIGNQGIDTNEPLYLSSDRGDTILLRDLLAIHMIRKRDQSTIITYHPSPEAGRTSAKKLHSRVHLAGKSVYWTNIFKQSTDPTFVLLTILWHALYSWDEALSSLYEHITDQESTVINTKDKNITQRTQGLHLIRAHLLHYASLLDDFRKSVQFVMLTPNPAMDIGENATAELFTREDSAKLLKTECNNLLSEIGRLEMSRDMQNKRLKNVMDLVFSSVNIEDSKTMHELTNTALKDSSIMKLLTQAAVQDSAAMKQIAYLTMIFLPASFLAGVFGMNVHTFNSDSHITLVHYCAAAIPLTLVTIWTAVAFNPKKNYLEGPQQSWSSRLGWPLKQFSLFRTTLPPRADHEAQ